MARIRTLKPEFFQDEKLAALDPLTRLVFLGLISQADDAGRLVDNVKSLDGLLFPLTDDSCAKALDILANLSRVIRYISASGQRLIQVAKWTDHQRVDHPNKHVLPAPTPEDIARPPLTESSRQPRESVAKVSRKARATTDDRRPVPTTNDQSAADAAPNGNGGGWTAEWAKDYKAKIGKIEPGRIGARCAEAVKEYGYTVARSAWQAYIRAQPHMRFGEFVEDHFDTTGMGPEQFMKTLTVWITRAETPMPRREIVHAPAPA